MTILLSLFFSFVAPAEVGLPVFIEVDHQYGLLAYQPILNGNLDLKAGEIDTIEVKFKNTNRKSLMTVRLIQYLSDKNALTIKISRQDYQDDEPIGRPTILTFVHSLEQGSSSISIRGKDPRSGPFRLKFHF